MTLSYIDYAKSGFTRQELTTLAEQTICASRQGAVLRQKSVMLDVAILPPEQMRSANKALRTQDRATDVLSIGEYSDHSERLATAGGEIMLGELLLCWSEIKKNATIQKTDASWEFAYVFTHGILHLLGYKHSEEMFALQKQRSDAFVHND